ncbi:cell division protein FtsZ [Benzoatithermus flavus]|uniref:Cell division protein FtsZ n=1 Tax=Benzoatithermus flavus TaxID=3108223 RepID=A0ABU8XQC7_9PROT
MTINLSLPVTHELKPKITVVGVGGAGGNAVNNMITSHLEGVEFVACNTDAQALANCLTDRKIQLGHTVTHGLGAGARPEVGRASAEEALDEILDQLSGSHMVFITAGMGGGTGTGAAPVIARAVREQGILTVAVVTKPFHFEGAHRMRLAEAGLAELQQYVDTLIVIPNQNLFRLANERTTFAEAFRLADQVLHMGVRGVTDLMVMPGLINLDFADIRTVMSEMGKAMMGTGEAEGERRAIEAAEAAISNPLLDDVSMKGARGVLINITGGLDMTLYEVDAAANRIREEVDPNANIIFGSTFDDSMQGRMRVSVVATGIDLPQERPAVAQASVAEPQPEPARATAGPFRFQPQRVQAVPFPGAAKAPVRRPGEVSPAVHLRAAAAPEQPRPELAEAAAAFTPAPAQEAAAPAAEAMDAAPAPAADVSYRSAARNEERPLNLFDRVKEFAFARSGGGAADRGGERQAPRLSDRPFRPVASGPAPLSGALDEIGDIPSFLRRERVEG